jgi:hypothetical protein
LANALSPRSLLLGGVCWCLCSAGRRRVVMARGLWHGAFARYGDIKGVRAAGTVGRVGWAKGTVTRDRRSDGTERNLGLSRDPKTRSGSRLPARRAQQASKPYVWLWRGRERRSVFDGSPLIRS